MSQDIKYDKTAAHVHLQYFIIDKSKTSLTHFNMYRSSRGTNSVSPWHVSKTKCVASGSQ